MPPFTDVLSFTPDHHLRLALSLGNYRYLLTDEVYGVAYLYSLRTAFFSTLICLALGYPMAYAIARAPKSAQGLLLLVIMLPFWTSFLLRVYALEGIIRDNGFLNTAAAAPRADQSPAAHHAHQPRGVSGHHLLVPAVHGAAAVRHAREARPDAARGGGDLGSTPWRAFLDVTLPLSMPGVIAGSMLVFIPAVGEFVIPSLLGGPESTS